MQNNRNIFINYILYSIRSNINLSLTLTLTIRIRINWLSYYTSLEMIDLAINYIHSGYII